MAYAYKYINPAHVYVVNIQLENTKSASNLDNKSNNWVFIPSFYFPWHRRSLNSQLNSPFSFLSLQETGLPFRSISPFLL
jgi:hypothetical protein